MDVLEFLEVLHKLWQGANVFRFLSSRKCRLEVSRKWANMSIARRVSLLFESLIAFTFALIILSLLIYIVFRMYSAAVT